jgi:predicted ATPase
MRRRSAVGPKPDVRVPDLPGGVTLLTGENGVGKSAVIEVIAEACGLNPQGGSAKTRFQAVKVSLGNPAGALGGAGTCR